MPHTYLQSPFQGRSEYTIHLPPYLSPGQSYVLITVNLVISSQKSLPLHITGHLDISVKKYHLETALSPNGILFALGRLAVHKIYKRAWLHGCMVAWLCNISGLT